MHFTLQNEQLLVTIASWGAELISIKDRQTGLEYIWQGNPDVWARHAPILFPIVGRLKNDVYRYGDRTYFMTQHGFARDSEFTCLDQMSDQIRLQLNANETTRDRYPFEFSLTVTYQLLGNQVQISYRIENWQSDPIYCSIGSHPGFTCPILPDSQFDDYELRWEVPETLDRYYLSEGLRDGRHTPLMDGAVLPLTHSLFQEDALIVKSPQSQQITLAHSHRGEVLSVKFPKCPYLGIWTKPTPNAEFICIEPWQGITDAQEFAGDFSDKEGMLTLLADQSYETGYTIEIHPRV